MERLQVDFGGIPTFCEDPDGLLELPEVREALRSAGMQLGEWDGARASLRELLVLDAAAKPLWIARDARRRHLAEEVLSAPRWVPVSIGALFPRFSVDVVRSVPSRHWDRLLPLHAQTRSLLNAHDTALLIGRAVFGIDPLHLELGEGWLRLVALAAAEDHGMPRPIAETLARRAPDWLDRTAAAEVLTDPAAARAAVRALHRDQPALVAAAPAPVRVLLEHALRRARTDRPIPSRPLRVREEGEAAFDSVEAVLRAALRRAEAEAFGEVSRAELEAADIRFTEWIQQNYSLILSSQNANVLKLSGLIGRLHEWMEGDRLLLLVVDSLGLSGWYVCEQVWRELGTIGRAETRAAFAVLPTLTLLSRRALFEGKLASQFSAGKHSQALERKLWEERFPGDGAYFNAEEGKGIEDAFSLGRSRVCVVDTAWDRRGHAIDPQFETIEEVARVWAERTGLRDIVKRGLSRGYLVVITSDHGHVVSEGIGRPPVGELVEDRSRRVLLFQERSLWEQYSTDPAWKDRYLRFLPSGLPADCFPLFAAGHWAFAYQGSRGVSHGGISPGEAIVPVAEVFAS